MFLCSGRYLPVLGGPVPDHRRLFRRPPRTRCGGTGRIVFPPEHEEHGDLLSLAGDPIRRAARAHPMQSWSKLVPLQRPFAHGQFVARLEALVPAGARKMATACPQRGSKVRTSGSLKGIDLTASLTHLLPLNRTTKPIRRALARYFETLLHDNPTFSTLARLREGRRKLGRLTLDFQKKRERERHPTLRALEGISRANCRASSSLTGWRCAALLLKECEGLRSRPPTRLEPIAPTPLLNILLHELQRGDDEPSGRRATCAHCLSRRRIFWTGPRRSSAT